VNSTAWSRARCRRCAFSNCARPTRRTSLTALTRQYNQRSVDERNEKPVSITADSQTNALIVAAHAEMMPEIQAIVAELNATTRLDSEGREIRIFPLSVARAEELARTIDEMFPAPPMPIDRRGRPMPHLQEPPEVVVRADPQTNSIIVDAPVQRMANFEKLVEQLDRQKITEETAVRTYAIVHADLNAIARTLQQLASSGALSLQNRDRRVAISINTEPVSQRIVVSGPIEIFDRVEQVLAELDVRQSAPRHHAAVLQARARPGGLRGRDAPRDPPHPARGRG
jgi:type II secretory pathway component GspD/PulD (secretin)